MGEGHHTPKCDGHVSQEIDTEETAEDLLGDPSQAPVLIVNSRREPFAFTSFRGKVYGVPTFLSVCHGGFSNDCMAKPRGVGVIRFRDMCEFFQKMRDGVEPELSENHYGDGDCIGVERSSKFDRGESV